VVHEGATLVLLHDGSPLLQIAREGSGRGLAEHFAGPLLHQHKAAARRARPGLLRSRNEHVYKMLLHVNPHRTASYAIEDKQSILNGEKRGQYVSNIPVTTGTVDLRLRGRLFQWPECTP